MLTLVKNTAWIAAVAWAGLVVARGHFWDSRADRLADPEPGTKDATVHVVIPARNEGDVIERTLASVLAQRGAGYVRVTVVNDRSEDDTAAAATRAIVAAGAANRARVIDARPRPDGWTGKVWAMSEGVRAVRGPGIGPTFWWLTDADVEHADDTLARLLATARIDERDLVSLMVMLHCSSPVERLLIPAFVFFFRMLYPFEWVNDRTRATSGAAGGCVLLRATLLDAIGGMECIRGELIDDCSLATAVQRAGGALWLGLTNRSRSVRPYPSLGTIWSMVARTAYTQLQSSPLLLTGTVAAMSVLYLAPVGALALGMAQRRPDVAIPGALAWGLMSAAFVPTMRLYRQPWWWALTLPFAGMLYTAMTVDSARSHRAGRGGMWKGRTFTAPTGEATAGEPTTRG